MTTNYSTKTEQHIYIEYKDAEGRLHRVDGPAVEYKDGSYSVYYWHGMPHRLEGPYMLENYERPLPIYLTNDPYALWGKFLSKEEWEYHTIQLASLEGTERENYIAYFRCINYDENNL